MFGEKNRRCVKKICFMKIGLAQINTIVGDLDGNLRLLQSAYQSLVDAGADLVLFPELALCGYPPRDLVLKSRFVADNHAHLALFAKNVGKAPAIVGFVDANTSGRGRPCRNAAAWCEQGEVKHVAYKCLLPTYDVFDEDRYFEPADEPTVIDWNGKKIGITICEDIWTGSLPIRSRYAKDPLSSLETAGLYLLLNLSASPWHRGKGNLRLEIIHHAAARCGCPVAYCNSVGGNDELIFDGHSVVMRPDGQLLAGLAGFAPDTAVVPLDSAPIAPRMHPAYAQDSQAEVFSALVLGLRDYAHKSGFKRALLGLSGGIDSALVAVIAAEALGKENVIGVSLPSAISSQHSQDDAEALAANLGIPFRKIGIKEVVAAAETTLSPLFSGMPRDVTEENIQARARGLLLMAMSNKFSALLLTTGNKSEMAVGYCTLYGDMCGGLAVISDLPKMDVYALCRWINREKEIIPANTIEKPPSAELRPNQKDQDSLPPYDLLDAILRLYVEEGKSRAEITALGFDEATVRDICRKVDLNEYKRKQAAPGLKITPLAFGVGRRIPIVQKYVS